MNKRGASTGFAWIFALVTLFGLGVLYIVFNQVLTVYIAPTIKAQMNNSYNPIDNATIATVNGNIDKYLNFFNSMPYILFIVVVIFMIVVAIRKERESEFM